MCVLCSRLPCRQREVPAAAAATAAAEVPARVRSPAAVLESLFVQLRKAQSNPDVKAILLTGAGGKIAGIPMCLLLL